LATEWKAAVLAGWAKAAECQGSVEWVGALVDAWREDPTRLAPAAMFGVLPAEQRERIILQSLSGSPAWELLPAHPDWSVGLSRAVLKALRRRVAEKPTSPDWPLRTALKGYASRLNVAVAEDAGQDWPTEAESWKMWSKGIEEMLAILQFRHYMRKEIEQ